MGGRLCIVDLDGFFVRCRLGLLVRPVTDSYKPCSFPLRKSEVEQLWKSVARTWDLSILLIGAYLAQIWEAWHRTSGKTYFPSTSPPSAFVMKSRACCPNNFSLMPKSLGRSAQCRLGFRWVIIMRLALRAPFRRVSCPTREASANYRW